MKKMVIILTVVLTGLFGMAQSSLIWDFETPSGVPSSITFFSQFYVYTTSTVAGKGIGGSNALEITLPAYARTWGGGFDLNASPALNLAGSWMYGYISADTASPFGVAFEVRDTTGGYQFIPPPGPYTSYAQKFAGSIDSTFKKVEFNLNTFDRYGAGTGTPDLGAITRMTWIFPDNTAVPTGPMKFYLDNIGVSAVPVELSSFKSE